jgi:hypothetical protein
MLNNAKKPNHLYLFLNALKLKINSNRIQAEVNGLF